MTTASSRPSVPMEQLSSHRTEYHDISDEYFSKSCRWNSSFITTSNEWGILHADHSMVNSTWNEKCFKQKL